MTSKTKKFKQAKECLEFDKGRIGLLRLRNLVGDFFGSVDDRQITNWLRFMKRFKFIKEVSTGQWSIL